MQDAVQDLPPTAKLVYRVLREEDDLTTEELSKESMLPESSVRRGIRALREADVVERHYRSGDARVPYYSLDE